MNMHGFMTPAQSQPTAPPSWRERMVTARRRYGWFLAVVVLPCLLVGGYLYLFAADQYVSEAHYLVRAQGGTQTSSSGLGSLIGGGAGGGGGAAAGAAAGLTGAAEANSVSDYLTSHDVVNTLRRTIDLVALFRRPEADALSRLRKENPTPEELLKFYRRQVDVHFDSETGITELKVRAFRREDAYLLARSLLALGEQRVNEMNERAYRDAMDLARRRLAESTQALTRAQLQLTAYRQSERDVNPAGTATAQIGLVSRLTEELASARAQLATTARLIGTNNPQYAALVQQVRSLESQVASQNSRLAGGSGTIAAGLGGYERLQLEQELAGKRYDAAASAFEQARQQAVRQQLYVVRVVDPNMPVKSLYPRRALMLLTLFVVLLVVYGIGWLIAAGVREHAA